MNNFSTKIAHFIFVANSVELASLMTSITLIIIVIRKTHTYVRVQELASLMTSIILNHYYCYRYLVINNDKKID